MFVETSLSEQYAQAAADDLKILIVGAGIAGVTAAQLLRNRGRHPVLVERAKDTRQLTEENLAGYMLALMPMVDPVFDELELWQEYRSRSVQLDRFRFHGHRGRSVRTDRLGSLLAEFGEYRGIARGALLDVLGSTGCQIIFDSTVAGLEQDSAGAEITIEAAGERHQLRFDLVIIADGIHSQTRRFVLGRDAVQVVDTGWGGWVVWAPTDAETDLGEEVWGADFFLGAYPVQGRLGVFLGGSNARTAVGPRQFVAQVRDRLVEVGPRIDRVLTAVAESEQPYYWPLTDCRVPQWVDRRVVLLGDAGAGFLPTAGIGAGMAMESAWVLASLLRDAQPETLPGLLQAYQSTQRPRVEAAQDNSRQLAKMMFHNSRLLAVFREVAMRVLSVGTVLKPIQQLLATRPDPATLRHVASAKVDHH